jgi:hypothetical protein
VSRTTAPFKKFQGSLTTSRPSTKPSGRSPRRTCSISLLPTATAHLTRSILWSRKHDPALWALHHSPLRMSRAPPTSSGSNTKLPHFIAYALHRTKLQSSVTFASPVLLQRLKVASRRLEVPWAIDCSYRLSWSPQRSSAMIRIRTSRGA